MPESRADRVREVLDLAMERPSGERAAFVDGAAGGDVALREEVLSLLGALERAGDVLEPVSGAPALVEPAATLTGLSFGAYVVGERIGAGAMGVVYAARDGRLGRTVAVKTLPPGLARDPHRRARLEHEARLLASLNHPNIASIYGIEDTPRGPVLVLELVMGQTLSELLTDRRLTVDEALGIVRQIARGLESAHGAGIVHRDLKPSNIKVTPEGVVKILDLGIAKAGAGSRVEAGGTDARDVTLPGVIVGTAAYMSPEQARGRPVDRRTDLWALGCVMFELLSGRRPFDGETASDAVAAVLRGEPDWALLPAGVPGGVARALRRCLQKDPEKRLRDAGDLVLDLEEEVEVPEERPRVVRRWPWLAAGAALGALVALGAVRAWRGSTAPAIEAVTRVGLELPAGAALAGEVDALAIDPAGTAIAYLEESGEGKRLYLRRLDEFDARLVPDSSGARTPFFSPDGEWLAFQSSDSVLFKVPVRGGAAIKIGRVSVDAFSFLWLPGGDILYSHLWKVGVSRIRSTDGSSVDSVGGPYADKVARASDVLPDGRTVLMVVGTPSGKAPDEARVEAWDIESNTRVTIARAAVGAWYVEPGYLVLAWEGALKAARFDARTLELEGEAAPVQQEVSSLGLSNAFAAVARAGTVVFAPGPVRHVSGELGWISRDGSVSVVQSDVRSFTDPQISPDGNTVVVAMGQPTTDLYLLDLQQPKSSAQQITAGRWCSNPFWSPSGDRIAFVERNLEGTRLWISLVSPRVESAVQRVFETSHGLRAWGWTPDGLCVAVHESRLVDGVESSRVMLVPVDGSAPREIKLPEKDVLAVVFSPDGRWLAYSCGEFDQQEVYVRSWPDLGSRTRVSFDGGGRPVWRRDGKELYYQHDGSIWSAPLVGTDPLRIGAARRLIADLGVHERYDVSPDGLRILVPRTSRSEVPLNRLSVVRGWDAELWRLSGAGKR